MTRGGRVPFYLREGSTVGHFFLPVDVRGSLFVEGTRASRSEHVSVRSESPAGARASPLLSHPRRQAGRGLSAQSCPQPSASAQPERSALPSLFKILSLYRHSRKDK